MTLFYEDPLAILHLGDCRQVLAELPAESIHCVVTSPPYMGLRDYGIEPVVWGAQDGCVHEWGAEVIISRQSNPNTGLANTGTGAPETRLPGLEKSGKRSQSGGSTCHLCGAWRGTLGLEPTPQLYVQHLVEVFREVMRVLRPDGTVWLNLGDCYAQDTKWGGASGGKNSTSAAGGYPREHRHTGIDSKALVGVPWRVAFALQGFAVIHGATLVDWADWLRAAREKADWEMVEIVEGRLRLAALATALEDSGWLRSDIIWAKCLSGGTKVYARSQKGDMPMTIREMSRLSPNTVKLWSGDRWLGVLAVKEVFPSEAMEIRLRNGQSLNCTPDHRWPLKGGLLADARDLKPRDTITTCGLPEPDEPQDPAAIPTWVGRFIGLFIAEGSYSGDTIQFSLGAHEAAIAQDIKAWAEYYGGSCHIHRFGGSLHVNVESKLCAAILSTYVVGRTAKRKHLTTKTWQRRDSFLRSLLHGYLEGDGHERGEGFWDLGFTANEAWANDLRTIGARLDMSVRLKWGWATETGSGKRHKVIQGSIRCHRAKSADGQILTIARSKGRRFFDIVLEGEPHQFALASGVLSHNSNPMPESVTDRPTRSHEYVFLLTKNAAKPIFWTHREGGGTREHPRADYRWVNLRTDEQVDSPPADWKEKITCPACDGSGETQDWEEALESPECRVCMGKGKVTLWKRLNMWRGRAYYYDADAVREPAVNLKMPGHNMTDTRETYGPMSGGNSGLRDLRRSYHEDGLPSGRNRRSVWNIPTQPYKHAHFATFPEDLVRPCVLAGTSGRGCCPYCGAPWERMMEKGKPLEEQTAASGAYSTGEYHGTATKDYASARAEDPSAVKARILEGMRERKTIGWQPTCSCSEHVPIPCTVLDPFTGSGTTGVVARSLSRRFVGIDCKDEYLALAKRRIEATQPGMVMSL